MNGWRSLLFDKTPKISWRRLNGQPVAVYKARDSSLEQRVMFWRDIGGVTETRVSLDVILDEKTTRLDNEHHAEDESIVLNVQQPLF